MQKNAEIMHYHVQDVVLYGQSGVCRIADIAEKDMAAARAPTISCSRFSRNRPPFSCR